MLHHSAQSLCLGLGLIAGGMAMAAGPPKALAPWRRPLTALPIAARIKVPAGPAWLETGFGSVWVTKIEGKRVLRIDPGSNAVVADIALGSKPELAIGVGLGSVWIADTQDRTVSQIDPHTNAVVRVLPVDIPDETEGSFGVGDGSLWLLTNAQGTDSGSVSRLDVVSGKVVANIRVPPKSHCALYAFDAVWVTSTGGNSVSRIDPRSNAVVATIPVHAEPRFLAAGDGAIWVVSQGDGTLARIDPETNRVTATIAVSAPGPGGDIAVGAGNVWVSAEGAPLSQVDPRSNRLVRQYVGGTRQDTLRVAFGAAWVVDELGGEIWRIDLRRVVQ